ncbi:MAG TPA: hypothetical protein ENO21_03585, partial [Firmicutes bacterium]|nr:hypothetical protein [Bacillota bacterium]
MRQVADRLPRYLALTLLPLLALACLACGPREFHGKDKEMMERVGIISDALSNYQLANAEWPESLSDVRQYLAYGERWPANPYDGKPIADTGSPEFDPAASVGMVFYQKLCRDDRLINYQLHVFGDKGKL